MLYLLCSPEALLFRESEELTSQNASHQFSLRCEMKRLRHLSPGCAPVGWGGVTSARLLLKLISPPHPPQMNRYTDALSQRT